MRCARRRRRRGSATTRDRRSDLQRRAGRHWPQVKSCGSQNESHTTTPPDVAAADGAAPGARRRGAGLVPLAFSPTPGRKRPKLLKGGLVPRSSGPKRLLGAPRLDLVEPRAETGSRGDGRVPPAFGPTPGRKRPKLLNGGFAPRSRGPRRLDGAVRLEVLVGRMREPPSVVEPKPSIGRSTSMLTTMRSLCADPPTVMPVSAPPSDSVGVDCVSAAESRAMPP